jgi:hypothetical protein
VAAGVAAFTVCLALQLGLHLRVLVPGLGRPEPEAQSHAVRRWFKYAVVLQCVVVVAVVAYGVRFPRPNPIGAWGVPPLAALVGTALPLQMPAIRILRWLSG